MNNLFTPRFGPIRSCHFACASCLLCLLTACLAACLRQGTSWSCCPAQDSNTGDHLATLRGRQIRPLLTAAPTGKRHLHELSCKHTQATGAKADLLALLTMAEDVEAAKSAQSEPHIDGTVATASHTSTAMKMLPQDDPRNSDQLEHHDTVHGNAGDYSKLQTLQHRQPAPHSPRQLSWPDQRRRVPATKKRDAYHRKLTGLGAWASRPVGGKPRTPSESVTPCAAGHALPSRGEGLRGPIPCGSRRVWGVNDSDCERQRTVKGCRGDNPAACTGSW